MKDRLMAETTKGAFPLRNAGRRDAVDSESRALASVSEAVWKLRPVAEVEHGGEIDPREDRGF